MFKFIFKFTLKFTPVRVSLGGHDLGTSTFYARKMKFGMLLTWAQTCAKVALIHTLGGAREQILCITDQIEHLENSC